MDKLKKLNGSMIAAIVLSVLLIMSVTAGATLAWFASRDSASTSLTMGEAVVVTIGEDYKQGNGVLAMNLPVSEGGLLPGMSVTPNIKVQLQKSNTNALLRARFITTAEYPDGYVDAAYADTTKYPGTATSGRVLDATAFPDDHVYAGSITYTYYNSVGAVASTTTKALTRVEVRQDLVDALNKTGAYTAGEWSINGITTAVTADNIAELEIRQRGVDLTNAINRVLAGQRGYGIDPVTGDPMLDATVGVKYTRRVADGWAYREADQAWYYLGSQTNGFVTANATGVDETVTTTQAAKDIAWYSTETAGNLTVQQPHYTTLGYASNPYKTTTVTQGTNIVDKARNYLGGTEDDNSMDIVANEIAVLNQNTISSIDLSAGNVSIDFLTKRFVLPTFINNNYAQAEITFTFTVEAVQDYLVDPLQEATSAADRLPNNLVNAILVFNNAFPQAFTNQEGNAALEATGVAANVVPGGGIPSSVKWSNAADGATTLEYTGVQTQGALYSYGYLSNDTISGTAYTYDDPSTIEVDTNGSATATIKGFGVKIDDYGDYVADYTVAADYVRGTASSLGIAPFIAAQVGTAGTDETWPATGA